MRSDIFNYSCLLKQEKLWQDGNSLKKYREGPKNLKDRQPEVKHEGQNGSTDNEKLESKGVMNAIVGVFVALLNEIDGISRGGDEEDLHDGVVEGESRVPRLGEKKVEIAGRKDDHV